MTIAVTAARSDEMLLQLGPQGKGANSSSNSLNTLETTMTPNETSPDQAVEAVARAIGKVLGLDIREVCGITEDAGECDSSTCPGALTDDHDAEDSVETLRRMATAAIAAITTPPPADHTDPDFDAWSFGTVDPRTGMPLLTTFLHRVCANDEARFSEGLDVLRAAFNASRLQAHASPREPALPEGSYHLEFIRGWAAYRTALDLG